MLTCYAIRPFEPNSVPVLFKPSSAAPKWLKVSKYAHNTFRKCRRQIKPHQTSLCQVKLFSWPQSQGELETVGECAWKHRLIIVPDTSWLVEEADKTSKFRQLLIVRWPKVTNSLCVTGPLIMSHCAGGVAFSLLSQIQKWSLWGSRSCSLLNTAETVSPGQKTKHAVEKAG